MIYRIMPICRIRECLNRNLQDYEIGVIRKIGLILIQTMF
jgi:hypothetical protein